MKIGRDAFLYLEPKGEGQKFAQCSTCAMHPEGSNRCTIHGPNVTVSPNVSCGFYVQGTCPADAEVRALVTPYESGLVHRQVRCENCIFFDDDASTCDLYSLLDKVFPDKFSLGDKVKPLACCNANTVRG